jgi:hypothetical protein
VRVLLDENLPHDLIAELSEQHVTTVQGLGWTGVKNGELLRRAAGQIDALLTMDRKLEHQHDVSALPFGLIVARAHSNRMQALRPLVGEMQDALARVRPGTVQDIGKVGPTRRKFPAAIAKTRRAQATSRPAEGARAAGRSAWTRAEHGVTICGRRRE